MSLPDAIRAGAAKTLPLREHYRLWGNGRNQPATHACALGCALLTIGVPLPELQREALIAAYPDLALPCGHDWCDGFPMTVSDLIVQLNDTYGVPREEIADYVEWLLCRT